MLTQISPIYPQFILTSLNQQLELLTRAFPMLTLHVNESKVYRPDVVTLLNQTPTFEWYTQIPVHRNIKSYTLSWQGV